MMQTPAANHIQGILKVVLRFDSLIAFVILPAISFPTDYTTKVARKSLIFVLAF